jgi:3-phenylpropionate/trans-cinnamate dioxygenase ferredoxin subunit
MPWIHIANSDQLQDGEVIAISIDKQNVALYQDGDSYFATDNVCTHQFALLSDGYFEDGCIECPLHQARFDVRTGKALCAPATTDLRTFPTKREGIKIFLHVE